MTDWYPSQRPWVARGLAIWFALHEMGETAREVEWNW